MRGQGSKQAAAGGLGDVAARLLASAGIEVNGPNSWDPQVHEERVWVRAVRDRELGLGEAYQDGWFDVEELDEFLARLVLADVKAQVSASPSLLWIAGRQLLRNRQTIARARANAQSHYDIGNDLYERMLDKRMIYSCGYWRRAVDLDAAQDAKLDLICQKLHLEPGMRVLDIGCGWGGLAHYMASEYGAIVTGVSPAAEQVRVARERCAGLAVTIDQIDYREVTGEFDRIVSVGMMEHVGTRNLDEFFATCDRLLTAEGVMLHHTIGRNRSSDKTDAWFDKYIFPGGVIPSLGQVAEATDGRWAIEDVHNFGPDYDRTLMAWSANIEQAWNDLPSYDERFRRTWHYYLMASAAGFRTRNLQLWQVVFTRAERRSDTYEPHR